MPRAIPALSAAAFLILGLFWPNPVVAQSRYCATTRGADMGYRTCGFQSFETCLAEIRGMGGSCSPDPRYDRSRERVDEHRPRRQRVEPPER